jgi:hypothetical protein
LISFIKHTAPHSTFLPLESRKIERFPVRSRKVLFELSRPGIHDCPQWSVRRPLLAPQESDVETKNVAVSYVVPMKILHKLKSDLALDREVSTFNQVPTRALAADRSR